ncbi:MAG: hypothetical protein Q4G08_07130 [Capnocytophaga sp.]|nr:hypothetical protein [Capnocytophaga sp.]
MNFFVNQDFKKKERIGDREEGIEKGVLSAVPYPLFPYYNSIVWAFFTASIKTSILSVVS